MKKFFLDLLSANSPLSSKRFAGLLTLISCIILAFLAAYKNEWVTPPFMYDGLLLVVGGLFGFNMAEAIFKKTDSKTAETKEIEKAEENKPKE
jgi:hypothetical protein